MECKEYKRVLFTGRVAKLAEVFQILKQAETGDFRGYNITGTAAGHPIQAFTDGSRRDIPGAADVTKACHYGWLVAKRNGAR